MARKVVPSGHLRRGRQSHVRVINRSLLSQHTSQARQREARPTKCSYEVGIVSHKFCSPAGLTRDNSSLHLSDSRKEAVETPRNPQYPFVT